VTKLCADRDLPDLIVRPITTEKATILIEDNQYVFDVLPKATKTQIKAAIETLFSVKVTSVNTMNLPRKQKRVGKFVGYKTRYKRAIVTLAQGNAIILYPDIQE
jgi:large subunit ribosomal protein L23